MGTSVKGPTYTFPGCSSGGDLLRSTQDREVERRCVDDVSGDVNGDKKEEGEKEIRPCIVQAVVGRLLRFDGLDLHTVPHPTDI